MGYGSECGRIVGHAGAGFWPSGREVVAKAGSESLEKVGR
jgi:hypothetical protein